MTKRLFTIIILTLLAVLPSSAVLKEENLDNTLNILRAELTAYRLDLEKETKYMQWQQQQIIKNIIDVSSRSSQNSLMLYSQKQDYIFDLTYACHEATEMYMQFQKQALPFRNYIDRNKREIARYDSLIANLSQMPVMNMSDQAKTDRSVCLTLAVNIRHTLSTNNEQMDDYIAFYQRTEERLRNLNDYAQKRYVDIQSSIFKNGGDNYLSILKKFNTSFKSMEDAVSLKYTSHKTRVRSQWDIRVIFFLFAVILLYGFVAFGLNFLFIRFVMPKRLQTPNFKSKKTCIMMATTMVTLAIILCIVRLIISTQNFLIMASGLMIEYTWLLSVILISLLLRLNEHQIKRAYRIYAPLIFMGFLVIFFRIVLIPNDLVNLFFPPILLICSIWQWIVVRKHNNSIPKSDVYYTYISLIVFIVSVILSWSGYTLFSVQALIWWIMQLTCILTITCISGWMKEYAKRHHYTSKPINKTWLYYFCSKVLLPILAVLSVMLSIYWAADVFNLSDTTWEIFKKKFINTPNFSCSINGVCIIFILYFLFSWVNSCLKELLAIHFEKSDHSTAASRNVLAKNIVQIIVWGLWLLIALSIFHVSTTWLAVITGGLSTGVGFASKDIIENIYYGISLMAGRVKIGDQIECDGIRGTVSSISYTSTLVDLVDGSTMAFQNSQLFTKNYKNMTMNHGWELDILEVGVAYGTDIDKTRELLVRNISNLSFYSDQELTDEDKKVLEGKEKVKIILSNFGDSSVDLKVCIWVPVMRHVVCDGMVRECIYKTLNDNNIEIPFPQMDVHKK